MEYEAIYRYGQRKTKKYISAESNEEAFEKAKNLRKGFISAERTFGHREAFLGDYADELI